MDAAYFVRCLFAIAGLSFFGTDSVNAQMGPMPNPMLSRMPSPMPSHMQGRMQGHRPVVVRSENFIVSAATQAMADEVAQTAEQQRHDLAIHWLGQPLPNWSQACPITVLVGPQIGAGGSTTFTMSQGAVGGWRMNVQGSRERILDSVLPHEITHTLLASHFAPLGKPVPRWADEGACTTVEHASEKSKHDHFLVEFLSQGRGIPFATMFSLKEYPADIMPLYAQGYSVSCFLIAQSGPRRFVQFLEDGMRSDDWVAATEKHYGYPKIGKLQSAWNQWVGDGGGSIAQHTADALGLSHRAIAANANRSGVEVGSPAPQLAMNTNPVALTGATQAVVELATNSPLVATRLAALPKLVEAIGADSWYKRQLQSNGQLSSNPSESNSSSTPATSIPFSSDYSVGHTQPIQSLGNQPSGNWTQGPNVPIYR
ncbi:MAG: hypothetical protein SGI77_26035 [Pirellulaceae bacterium]|nr:hypothetical protein [Pirellulaceae bacterium]